MGKRMQQYYSAKVTLSFDLTLSKSELERLFLKIYADGIGDWAVIEIKDKCEIRVIDIENNKEFTLKKDDILKALSETIIDFPYALNTEAGYNINIKKLTSEDMDELVQVACYGDMKYRFTR